MPRERSGNNAWFRATPRRKRRRFGLDAFEPAPKDFSRQGLLQPPAGFPESKLAGLLSVLAVGKCAPQQYRGSTGPVSNYQTRENSGQYRLMCRQRQSEAAIKKYLRER
jgi:hypothetical protein